MLYYIHLTVHPPHKTIKSGFFFFAWVYAVYAVIIQIQI